MQLQCVALVQVVMRWSWVWGWSKEILTELDAHNGSQPHALLVFGGPLRVLLPHRLGRRLHQDASTHASDLAMHLV